MFIPRYLLQEHEKWNYSIKFSMMSTLRRRRHFVAKIYADVRMIGMTSHRDENMD